MAQLSVFAVISLVCATIAGGVFGWAAGAGVTWLMIVLGLVIVFAIIFALVHEYCWPWDKKKETSLRTAKPKKAKGVKASLETEHLTFTLPGSDNPA